MVDGLKRSSPENTRFLPRRIMDQGKKEYLKIK